jgi:DNA-binding NtrC family response regulator
MKPAPPPDHWPLATVLVVDDEPGMRNFLVKTLTAARAGQVHAAGSAEAAEELLRATASTWWSSTSRCPGISGIELLKDLREAGDPCEVVLITAFADLDTAIEALRAGASDFILKPFRVTQILNALRHGLERAGLRRENWVLRRRCAAHAGGRRPGGRSIAIKGLQAALQRVAAVDSTVLLTGESGTGKELAALALHHNSPRAAGPFVPVNCATLSPDLIEASCSARRRCGRGRPGRDGLFVYAQGGTLFLDEVGELPPALQATLLRVLESAASARWAASRRSRWTCASSPPPTAAGRRGGQPAASARTCTTGCRWSRSTCRRCAPTRRTWPTWWRTSSPRWRRSWACRRSR